MQPHRSHLSRASLARGICTPRRRACVKSHARNLFRPHVGQLVVDEANAWFDSTWANRLSGTSTEVHGDVQHVDCGTMMTVSTRPFIHAVIPGHRSSVAIYHDPATRVREPAPICLGATARRVFSEPDTLTPVAGYIGDMATETRSDGSTRDERSSNKLDNLTFCLRMGCDAQLTSVNGSHEDLKIEYECEDGHSGAKCLTELATSDL